MSEATEARFAAYVEGLSSVVGHADRVGPMRDYCAGLMLPVVRKSVEPLAAATSPSRVSAQHQSLMHFISQSAWSDEKVLAKVGELVLPKIEAHGPIEAWIIEDTALRKKGRHSVGVARQHCGEVGKRDNCQVAVSLSLANAWASLPVAFRLYLPKEWEHDAERRRKAKFPEDIGFATKPEIALDQIRRALAAGLPGGVVLMDRGYSVDVELRLGVAAVGLSYVAGIRPNTLVFDPATEGVTHRPPPRQGRRGEPGITSVKEVALAVAREAWVKVDWREGTAEVLSSRFARVRLHAAHPLETTHGRPEEWLLIEWPEGEAEPTKYWLSSLPEDIALERQVGLAKLRWRIERDYQDLKQEVGLDHFEGRSWRGLHHHASLCIAAYGFLISERETMPPSALGRAQTSASPGLPADYRPRGSPAQAGAAHCQFNHHHEATPDGRHRQTPTSVPMLWTAQVMTQ